MAEVEEGVANLAGTPVMRLGNPKRNPEWNLQKLATISSRDLAKIYAVLLKAKKGMEARLSQHLSECASSSDVEKDHQTRSALELELPVLAHDIEVLHHELSGREDGVAALTGGLDNE